MDALGLFWYTHTLMALRSVIAVNDCISEYEQAALEKLEAGFTLLAGGSSVGIEVLALAVEMFLKAALFRFLGYSEVQPVSRENLNDLRSDISSVGVTISTGPSLFHDLRFLAEGLTALRRSGVVVRSYGAAHATRSYGAIAASPMSQADEADIIQRTARLMTNWSVGDRYKSTASAAKQDLEDVLDDAVGIAELYQQGRM